VNLHDVKAVRSRLGLGAYLAFAFSALSVLLTILLTVVIERTASAQVGTGIGSNLAELANQTTGRLDRSMSERYREIELIANRLSPHHDWERVQAELSAVQQSYPHYAWIGVADPQGVVRAASRGMLLGMSVAERPWFQQGLKGPHLGDVHEALLLASMLGGQSKEPLRFFNISFPLKEGGPVGVLGAHVSWDWARELRAVIFRPGSPRAELDPLIVSAGGVVLLGPKALEGSKLSLGSLTRAQAGETGYQIETWPDGVQYLVGFSKSKGFQASPGLGWTVLVRQELSEAYAPVRELQRSVLASGIVIALLFSLLGWVMARAITRPLLQLAESARELEAGAAVEVRPEAAYREVRTLGMALNSLVANLRRNESDLRELNVELERRVQLRTVELRDAFDRVHANEQRIQTILEAAQDPFIGIDPQGRITDWNSQAEVVFGWASEEVVGQQADRILLPPRFRGSLDAALADYAAHGKSALLARPIERLLIDRQGREIPVEIKVGLVDTGDERFFSAFVHDISKRREVERLKDEFVTTVSHELRTPLTAIYGSLNLLHSGMAGDLPPDAKQLVAISHDGTERLIRLVNDILDVEKIASGKVEYNMQRQPLRPLVAQALRDMQPFADGLDVQVALVDGQDAEVLVDADRIVQVCVNLLSNAIKFSPPGGTVEVALDVSAESARLSVADHGPGIPPEFAGQLFERFAQVDATDRRAKGGSGLGLNICRNILQAHRGTISYTSKPGVRTVFWFELPLA
jgi:PAS domain S-box-containing protein